MTNQTNEVTKLARRTATQMLDNMLQGKFYVCAMDGLDGAEIYETLEEGLTKDLIMSNLNLFNDLLNHMVFERINYLMAEGFVVYDTKNKWYRSMTEAEQVAFLNVN
jgi:hypothetical protein